MKQTIKLLFLSSEFPPGPGGIGTHAFQICSYLKKNNVEVFALVDQHYASEDEKRVFNSDSGFVIKNYQSHPIRIIQFIKKISQIKKIIKVNKPDILVASASRSVWLGAYASFISKTPLLAIGHGSEFGGSNPLKKIVNSWAFGRASHVVCVSNFTHQEMFNQGINPSSSSVINNGADSNHFFELNDQEVQKLKSELALTQKFILLTVGNVTHRKGQEIVIRALPAIIKEIPEVIYLMAGLPTLADELKKLAGKLGVEKHIRFMGQVDDKWVIKLNQIADIFLMTSQKLKDGDVEGFGIAVIEAALCGKPAIVSGDSGLKEAVIHGETGFVVPLSDPVATSNAVIYLFENDIIRQGMGKAAKQRALTEFTWEKVSNQYFEIIQQLVVKN